MSFSMISLRGSNRASPSLRHGLFIQYLYVLVLEMTDEIPFACSEALADVTSRLLVPKLVM